MEHHDLEVLLTLLGAHGHKWNDQIFGRISTCVGVHGLLSLLLDEVGLRGIKGRRIHADGQPAIEELRYHNAVGKRSSLGMRTGHEPLSEVLFIDEVVVRCVPHG